MSRTRREEVACIDLITQIRARMRNKIDACICKMASSSNIRYPILQGEGNFGDGFSGNHARNFDDRTVFKIEKNSPFFSNDYKNNAICNYSKKKWIFDEMDNCNYKMGEWSFVGRDEEPFGLNIVFPVLLCNGYSDYAPNCSWNYYKPSLEKIILPHNIINVTDSIKAVIENPNISDGELMKIIVGPDFPSGGVVNSKELEEIYKTGQGNLTVYAKIDVEYRRINIYLPFHVTVNDYWNEVFSKNIGIKTGEVYRNPNRIVIKVSENEDIDEVLSKLKQLKSLKKTFRVENKVLMDFEPKILNLRQMIDLYINNRYKALRGSDKKTKQKIISQLEELCIEFGDARRTEIKEF